MPNDEESQSVVRLAIGIDDVFVLRHAGGFSRPDPIAVAQVAIKAGAHLVTVRLRSDCAQKDDVKKLGEAHLPLEVKVAPTKDVRDMLLRLRPPFVGFIPGEAEDSTPQHSLHVVALAKRLVPITRRLRETGMEVSLFVDPDLEHITAAYDSGATCVELNTGAYCQHFITEGAKGVHTQKEWARIKEGAEVAHAQGLRVQIGHGLDFASVVQLLAIEEIDEVRVGHFLIGGAVLVGLGPCVKKMLMCIQHARTPSESRAEYATQ